MTRGAVAWHWSVRMSSPRPAVTKLLMHRACEHGGAFRVPRNRVDGIGAASIGKVAPSVGDAVLFVDDPAGLVVSCSVTKVDDDGVDLVALDILHSS